MRSDLQKLYNQTDNQVDLQSRDFSNVLDYLKNLGLSQPQVVVQEVGTPTGIRYTDIELVFTDSVRPPLKMQAFLVMNAPQRAVTDFDLWRGEQKPRIPDEYAPAPTTTAAAAPGPPPKPANPVGPLMFGAIFYPVAGDDSPNGTRHQDERGTFVKRVTATPFGNSVYWERLP